MIPSKLKRGDRVAVVAPARSMSIISGEVSAAAEKRLGSLGIETVIAENAGETDEFNSSSIRSRIEDLDWAFGSRDIKAVMTVIGGFNSNQLLRHMDYGLIRRNPKVLCGYSDITALQNAIYAKTGLVTYYGPHFSNFGMKRGLEYTVDHFRKCLFSSRPFEVRVSREWSDDPWYADQERRRFERNRGYEVIHEGRVEGRLLGGNLCTFNLLQGTEFMPDIRRSVLFLEDDHMSNPVTFDRDLQSLMHQPGFEEVRGIVIGRFQKASGMASGLLRKTIETKEELEGVPVIANADFGHTTPQFTFPIGGKARFEAAVGKARLWITEH